KGYSVVEFKKGGRSVRVVNVHLERLGRHKNLQGVELGKRFERPRMPTIIAGDFNADPARGGRVFSTLRQDYADAWQGARARGRTEGRRSGGTCCFRIPLTRSDHLPGSRWDAVLASKHLDVTGVALIEGRT